MVTVDFSSGDTTGVRTVQEQALSTKIKSPPGRGHIAALDGVRGLAIVMVLMQHYGGGRQSSHIVARCLGDALRLGWTGVSLFFVLSGFLISGILWDSIGQPHWWRRFYTRRSLRIFPLYYGVLAYAAVIGMVFEPQLLHGLWIYAFYLQDIGQFLNWASSLPSDRVVLDHFWSLAVEEQFYLVWPFVLMLMIRNRVLAMRVCLAVWVGSFALRLAMGAMYVQEGWLYRFPLSRAGELCMGAFLALWIRGNKESVERNLVQRAQLALFASAATLAALGLWTSGNFETSNVAWTTVGIFVLPVLFSSLIALCLRPGIIQRFFSLSALRWLGKISYGVYVYHLVLRPVFNGIAMRLLSARSATAQNLCASTIGIVGTLAAATLSFYGFEKHFLRLKERFES